MSALSTSLLQSLLGTQSATARQGSTAAASGGLNFASLLASARGGQVTSDRPVEVAPEVQGQLTPDQLSRLAVAVDHAESAGMSSALVLIDGKAVKVDVLSREATAVMDPRTVAVTDIDGVLAAPPSSLAAQVAGGDASSADPASLAGALEQQLLSRLGGRNAASPIKTTTPQNVSAPLR